MGENGRTAADGGSHGVGVLTLDLTSEEVALALGGEIFEAEPGARWGDLAPRLSRAIRTGPVAIGGTTMLPPPLPPPPRPPKAR